VQRVRTATEFGVGGVCAAFTAAAAALLICAGGSAAQDAPRAASQPAGAKPAPTRAQLEAALSKQLENVVFEGTFRVTDPPDEDGRATLGEARAEKYVVRSAHKAEGDWWVITARVQYDQIDVDIPIRLQVFWADETPVITLKELMIPRIGRYSARVLVHDGFYSGVWSGHGVGGVLSGQIRKAKPAELNSDED